MGGAVSNEGPIDRVVTMNAKSMLIQHLSYDFSMDLWSDVEMENAIALANDLSTSDWAELRETWGNLGLTVQARLAEIASETTRTNDDMVSMLLQMLCSEDPDVVEASIDSLNQIVQRSPEQIDRNALRDGLRGVSPRGRVVAKVLQSLKDRAGLQSSQD